jgi:hypothetical protein
MDVVVGLLLLGISAIVILDSVRIGFGWREAEGPAPGSFPFYVAALLALASIVNIGAALAGWGAAGSFVSRLALGRVLMVLVPSIIFVALITYIGIYLASAVFIIGFMVVSGENVFKSIAVGFGVAVALFLMFEKWFLVPLPRGPLETMLGL